MTARLVLTVLFLTQFLSTILCSSRRNTHLNHNADRHVKNDQRVYISQAHMQFTLDLLSSVVTENFNRKTKVLSSFVFSPVSIQSVLMMLHLGARGVTKSEIANVLYLSKLDNNATFSGIHDIYGSSVRSLLQDQSLTNSLSIANQVFVHKDLQISPTYNLALSHYYSTSLTPADFSRDLLRLINDFVSKQTKGLINSVLATTPPPSAEVIAVNALHFKGKWQFRFNQQETENEAWFHQTNGKRSKIQMMVGKFPIAHGYDEKLRASIIELPYRIQRLGLFLILPDEINGLFSLLRSLNATAFTSLITSMRKSNEEINVRLPKFKIETTPSLTNILRNILGLRTLFSNGEADLSGMFVRPSGRALVNEFIHKAILKIDEDGSVGVAASVAIAERIGLFNGKFFEADHPFLFFLTDKQSGLILFAGVFAGADSAGL